MSYCEQCKGEHRPARRIPSDYLASLWYAGRFAWHPEVFPHFIAWLRQQPIIAPPEVSDDDACKWLGHGIQGLKDLLQATEDVTEHTIAAPQTTFLVLRDVRISQSGTVTTTVCDDPASTVSVGMVSDDGSVAMVGWAVCQTTAESLIAILREQVGEPDDEVLTDVDTVNEVHHSMEGRSVHNTRE